MTFLKTSHSTSKESRDDRQAQCPSALPGAEIFVGQLASASPDLLRESLSTFVHALMSAEADAMCGAPYGTSSPERTNTRNGYRHREFDTRGGTLDMAIPKLRTGS